MSDVSDRFSNTTPRQRMLTLVGVVVVVAAIAWGIYWFTYARFFQSTDDAYVSGDVIALTSRDAATILAVHADNTQSVKRGQVLVEMDPIPAQVALQGAEADLASTVRNVRALFAKADELKAEVTQSQTALAQAEADYKRRVAASSDGAVSAEDITHARDALTRAKAALDASQSALSETQAQIQGTNVADNPGVLAAEARLRTAAIRMLHMQLAAPVSGVVAQRAAEVGEQVSPGTPLMAIVPLNGVWVDANFKENQLRRMRIGQAVTLTTDVYGGDVTFHGRVAGLSAGSGSAFALLPPQNASGNWIKIVQRVPVRIELDPAELEKHPLRIGLSVDATVDVRNDSGPLVTTEVRPPQSDDTTEATDIAAANAMIAKIVAANQGETLGDNAP